MATKNAPTATALASFAKTVKDNSTKHVGDAKKILEAITRLKTTNPSVYDRSRLAVFLDKRAKALQTLLGNYIVARLSSKYAMLAPQYF